MPMFKRTNDVKLNGAINYELVGGETLVLTEAPYGRVRKALKLITASTKKFQNLNDSNDLVEDVLNLVDNNLSQIYLIMIDEKLNPFFNAEWIENNLSIPFARQLIDDILEINGLSDFFGKKGQKITVPNFLGRTIEPKTELATGTK